MLNTYHVVKIQGDSRERRIDLSGKDQVTVTTDDQAMMFSQLDPKHTGDVLYVATKNYDHMLMFYKTTNKTFVFNFIKHDLGYVCDMALEKNFFAPWREGEYYTVEGLQTIYSRIQEALRTLKLNWRYSLTKDGSYLIPTNAKHKSGQSHPASDFFVCPDVIAGPMSMPSSALPVATLAPTLSFFRPAHPVASATTVTQTQVSASNEVEPFQSFHGRVPVSGLLN